MGLVDLYPKTPVGSIRCWHESGVKEKTAYELHRKWLTLSYNYCLKLQLGDLFPAITQAWIFILEALAGAEVKVIVY